jgi:chaperonin GroES
MDPGRAGPSISEGAPTGALVVGLVKHSAHRFIARHVESHARIHVNPESRSMNIRPLHDRILIQRLEEGEQKVGGIIIPDTAKEKPQQGKVIAAGSGKTKDDGKRIPLDVTAGDTILFGKYSGQEIKLDGEEYLIMKEDEVLAVIEGGTKHETKKRK